MIPSSKSPLRILVTAGPTREKLDPIRFISNYSTGLMGYEIARAAAERRHTVVLISGPTNLSRPSGVKFISVESALEMRKALLKFFPRSDALIMTSAICDWRPARISQKKLKRHPASGGRLTLELRENPDILFEAGKRKGEKVLVGFALETEGLLKNATRKLKEKNLDFIIANNIKKYKSPFGPGKIDALIIDRRGRRFRFVNCSKERLANAVIDKVERL